MDGSNLMAGAIAGVTTIKIPITAAYAVMMNSEHVMMVGKGAEKFAAEQGLKLGILLTLIRRDISSA
jgi:beta-aspartyl-peptidase (threonine type)